MWLNWFRLYQSIGEFAFSIFCIVALAMLRFAFDDTPNPFWWERAKILCAVAVDRPITNTIGHLILQNIFDKNAFLVCIKGKNEKLPAAEIWHKFDVSITYNIFETFPKYCAHIGAIEPPISIMVIDRFRCCRPEVLAAFCDVEELLFADVEAIFEASGNLIV